MPLNSERSCLARVVAKPLFLLGTVISLAAPASAWAQADEEEDALTREARVLMVSGIQYFERRQWDKAYEAFSAAWQAKKHFSILGNLAQTEVKLGKLADAANHWSAYLRILPAHRTTERAVAERHLENLRSELAALDVRVDVDGADVVLNGQDVGSSPLPSPVFAAPGDVLVQARRAGYLAAEERVSGRKGEQQRVELSLRALNHVAPEVPRALAPERAARAMPSTPAASAPPQDHAGRAREQPATTRAVVLGTGAVLSGLSAGLGIFLTIKANGLRDDEADLQRDVDTTYGLAGCAGGRGAGSRLCQRTRDTSQDRSDASSMASTAFVLAGALGAATVATYFIWKAPKEPSSALHWSVAPTLGGLRIGGEFQ